MAHIPFHPDSHSIPHNRSLAGVGAPVLSIQPGTAELAWIFHDADETLAVHATLTRARFRFTTYPNERGAALTLYWRAVGLWVEQGYQRDAIADWLRAWRSTPRSGLVRFQGQTP